MELYNKLIRQSREQITTGGIEKALKSLAFIAKTFELSKSYEDLVLLSSSYYELEIHHNSGTIDPDFALLQKNRIQQRLIKVVDEMEAAMRGKKFEIEVKIKGSADKKVSEWAQGMFA